VGLSTRELARVCRGAVILVAGGLLVALGLLGGVAVGSAGPVRGYTASTGTPAPWAVCWATVSTDLAVLERHLSPPGGVSVQAGTPVVFSGISGQPVTFAVASSPALLSSPDIDGGLGAAQPESAYTFTSAKATAAPGVVYWDASFSDAGVAECAGSPPATYTTQAQTLTVLPAPTTTPTPMPAPPAPPPPVRVSVSVPAVLRLAHSTLGYAVQCSASCSGYTSYEVIVVRRHAKPVRAPKLDFGPRAVSIAAAPGGGESFTPHYSTRALHLLKSLLADGGVVELRITVDVKDAASNLAQAHRTTRLRA
jgi:hypothetical protein